MPTQSTPEQRQTLGGARFIDPQQNRGETMRSFETVAATAPSTLPSAYRTLEVEVAGAGHLADLDRWLTETYATSLLVLDRGQVIHEWYAEGLGPQTKFLGASMTKSTLATLVGRAVTAGKLSLSDPVVDHVPELADSGYARCSVLDVITMTTGVDWVEDHRDPEGPAARLVAAFGSNAGSRAYLAEIGPKFEPGSQWEYNTADSQVLDWVRERATGLEFVEAMRELWTDLGAEQDAVVALDGQGVAMAGGGVAATTRDWARVGLLTVDGRVGGVADGERLLSEEWVAGDGVPTYPFIAPGRLPSAYTTHAGYSWHWWPLDRAGRVLVADGSHGQFTLVDRDRDVVVVKTSLWPYADAWEDRHYRDLSYLGVQAIADAVVAGR
ncbi:serine hydrolase domain-containing protein [Nocardioides insulae]|uniref:serine hydrolase domain-containing protein n=1 Tax=Nocardioides insulae TaxID=394734 RepID=UPI0004129662|nr:serine hydrolase domain-containing protein [Nocardioides insulae]